MKQIVFILLWALSLGCSTLRFSDHQQAVKIVSEPPGAEIRYAGKVVGVTPSFVDLHRDQEVTIELRYPGQKEVSYQIASEYRWWESFVPNLFLGTLAPFGIFLDRNTGTAWDLQPLQVHNLPGQPSEQVQVPRTLAIAPPQVGGLGPSDRTGDWLGQQKQIFNRYQVLPYRQTVDVFDDHHYWYDRPLPLGSRGRLYGRLKTTHVLESATSPRSKKQIEYQIRDVFSEQIIERGTLEPPDVSLSWREKWRPFFSGLIPNALTLDASSREINVSLLESEQPINSRAEPVAGWMGDLSKFLGTFGFASLLPPGRDVKFEAHLRMITLVNFNFSKFKFPYQVLDFEKTDFYLRRGMLAFGPQFYLESFLGVFHLDVMGGAGYSSISWKGSAGSGSLDRATLHAVVGVGYYRYLSDRLAVRIYMRNISEDRRNWETALDRSQGLDLNVTTADTTEAGVSLAIYFPEAGRKIRH